MKILIQFLSLLFPFAAFSCADFIIQSKDGAHVVGRSLEFALPLPANIVVHPKNETVQSYGPNQEKGISWTSKNSFVGLEVFGNVVLDGFNDKGLTYNILWFPDAKYPANTTGSTQNLIDFVDIGKWALGNFETVDQLKEALPKLQVYFHEIPEMKAVPPIHMIAHDNNGKSIVIEYIKGKLYIFDDPIGLLTNAPELPWHITNLRNYLNLTAIGSGPKDFNKLELIPTGQGNGLKGIPGDWTPPSRFVRLAIYKYVLEQPKDAPAAVNAAFHLLNTVDIPFGTVRGPDDKDFDYTQWVTVADLKNQKLYTREYADQNIKSYDLADEFKNGTTPKKIGVVNSAY